MAAPEKTSTITKETMIIIAVATFVIGFLSGIVFSVYKLGPASSTPQATSSQPMLQTPAGSGLDEETNAAILALEREVTVHADNVMAWTQLGHRYFDTNQPGKAIKAYNKALELDPNVPDVWTDLGIMYRRNGQPVDALKSFDKACEIDPAHQQARFNRGVVYLNDLNDPQKAIEVWKQLLASNPEALAPNGQPLGELIKGIEKSINK